MSDDAAIRRENLRTLMTARGWTVNDLKEPHALGYGRYTYWRDLLEDASKPFGEKAARKIEEKAGLPRYWMDTPASAAEVPTERREAPAPADLSDQEHELLAAFRLVSDEDRGDILAKAVQMALARQPAILQMMESAGVSRRADDAAVLQWWHRTQERAPREIKEAPSLHGEGGLVGGAAALKKHKAA